MSRQFAPVSTRYGAPMGRHSFGTLENVAPRKLRLFRVRLDSGGYDDGGAYWGHGGGSVWCATDGADFFQTCRAGSRERAALELEIAPDYLDRLARPINRARLANYALATLPDQWGNPPRAPKWDGWTEAAALDVARACGVPA